MGISTMGVIQEMLNESSLYQNTMSTTDIVATWKRETNNLK